MLREILTYLTTRCPAPVRRMGYLYESIAMRERYRRNSAFWDPHLDCTKAFISEVARECPEQDRVTVLGAGLLLDTPLDALAGTFRDVVLVDIVFLPEVKRRIRGYGNVRLLERDVTGSVETLYGMVRERRQDLPGLLPSLPGIDGTSGLVISLNLLSQLSVIPYRFIRKHLRGIPESRADAWCAGMILRHYQALKALPCTTCLISDYAYAHRDRDGRIIEQGSTLRGMDLPEPMRSWVWHIAARGEISSTFSKELHVGAWKL